MESQMVQSWLRVDPIRWLAGIFAGLLAGLFAMTCAMFLSSYFGYEFWFPLKLIATLFLGPSATQIGNETLGSLTEPILTGGIAIEVLSLFLGFIFGHFTASNRLVALFPMGLVWGVFSWIFIWNLFLPSAQPIHAAAIPSSLAFCVCLVFGLSLVSVAFFDRLFRGRPFRKTG